MVDELENKISTGAVGTRMLRVSIQYVVGEDRICMDGIDSQGKVKRLWLTARIIDLLAPHLLRIIGNPSQDTVLTDTALAQDLAFPEKVDFVEGNEEMLVECISIRHHNSAMTVIFKDCTATGLASLTLSPGEMLQWTNALKNCHLRAGWPASSWTKAHLPMPNESQNNSVTFH